MKFGKVKVFPSPTTKKGQLYLETDAEMFTKTSTDRIKALFIGFMHLEMDL